MRVDPEIAALTKQVDGVTVIDDNAIAAPSAGTCIRSESKNGG